MSIKLEPIIITPEQIIAAAQLIANVDEDAGDYMPGEYALAVRRYLNHYFSLILSDAHWYAQTAGFDASKAYEPAHMEESTELTLPPARPITKRRAALLAPGHKCKIEEDGDILYA